MGAADGDRYEGKIDLEPKTAVADTSANTSRNCAEHYSFPFYFDS